MIGKKTILIALASVVILFFLAVVFYFIKKNSKMFILYAKFKQYCKENKYLTPGDLLNFNCYYILSIEKEMSENYFTRQQMTHMITELLLSFCQGTELLIQTSSPLLNYLTGLLISDKCPYSSIQFLKEDKQKDFIDFLSIVKFNKNIKRIDINSKLYFNENDLTKLLKNLIDCRVINDLTIRIRINYNPHYDPNNFAEINTKSLLNSI